MINISKKVSSPNFHFIFDLLVFEYVFCVNKPSSDVKLRCYLMNLIGLSLGDLTQISACYFDLYLIDIFV